MNKVKNFLVSASAGLVLLSNTAGFAAAAAPVGSWDVTGSYDIGFQLTADPTVYTHDADLTQSGSAVDGVGGYPAGGPYAYEWDVTSGTVSGNTITLTVTYTVGAPGTIMNMTGTIAPNGSMSGTWDDNFGGARTGTWQTSSGAAKISVPSECDGMTIDNVVLGTSGSDNLVGTSGRDLILAKGGSDNVDGLGGNDCIVGGDGADNLIGGNGDDVLLGQGGADNLLGGAGGDKLYGGASSDSLKGEGGNDILEGQGGSDAANGGAGATDACNAEAETQCEL